MIQGEKVCLRPVTRADLPLLNSWTNDFDFHSEYNIFGLSSTNRIEQRFAEDGLLSERHGELLITLLTDTVIGSISYRQVSYGPRGSQAYNVGISLAVEHRGKGYGAEAQKLLAEYLLRIYPIMRVEASTDIENLPEQKALEKAGFTREGVLRQAQWRNGHWHDLVVYSKLRGE